jgi:hypothetical protein
MGSLVWDASPSIRAYSGLGSPQISAVERTGKMAKKTTVKVDGMVFDEACSLLEADGSLFDRDMVMSEIVHANQEIDDWQSKLNYMDSETLADWIKSFVLDPIDDFNRMTEDFYQEELAG